MIDVTFDTKQIEEIQKKLGKFSDQAKPIMAKAINIAKIQVKKEISTSVEKNYSKPSDVTHFKGLVKTSKATESKLTSIMRIRSKSEPVNHFPFSENEGVFVNISGEEKEIKGAFIRNVNGPKIWKEAPNATVKYQKTKKGVYRFMKLPIERLFSIPVAVMFSRPAVETTAEKTYFKHYEKALDKLIAKALKG